MAPLLVRAARTGIDVSPAEWYAAYTRIERGLRAPGRPCGELWIESFQKTMRALELECFADGGPGLVRSLGGWPIGAETPRILRRLARRRRLGLVANVDRVLLGETLGRLLCPFHALVTAEEAGAYKPDPAPFRLVLERLGLPPERVLHVAIDDEDDLAPARALGFRTARIGPGRGHTDDESRLAVDVEAPTLAALADLLGA